jgi:hypothetical protein
MEDCNNIIIVGLGYIKGFEFCIATVVYKVCKGHMNQCNIYEVMNYLSKQTCNNGFFGVKKVIDGRKRFRLKGLG